MAVRRRCAVCHRWFHPDVRSVGHQKYCSRRCAKKAKRERDRLHKKRYRETGLGQQQRRRENRRTRERVGWAPYMRYWRKAEPATRAAQERERARRYYRTHREEILQKRRERRAQKRAERARSH